MFQRIGVPLDGSARAEQALPIAARLAGASAGTVVLLRVVNPRSDLAPHYPSDQGVVQAMVHEERAAAQSYLEGITHMGLLADVRTKTAVLCGEPATRILSEAVATRIDLIVMCSHSYSCLERQLRASLAEKIVHEASIPVLVLREESMQPLASSGLASGCIRALVPLDGSDDARAALAPAVRLVAALSAPAPGALQLARVVVLPEAQGDCESEREAILQEARHSLERTVERLRENLSAAPCAGLHPFLSWCVTVDDDIASGICRLAEEGEPAAVPGGFDGADVIAMATRGFGELQRCVAGSVAQRVLRATRLPLLLVRPPNKSHVLQDQSISEKNEQGVVA